MRPVFLLALTVLPAFSGCGDHEQPPVEKEPPSAAEGGAVSPEVKTKKFTTAPVMVVDLTGRPLSDMLPIATEQPNAFEKPVRQGELTGADGRSVLMLPRDVHLYVRAWDPAMRMFPNNFYEVLPATGDSTDTMTITMAEGATLAMTLLDGAQEPAANENVGLMMFHAVHGAWWPAEGDTDGAGRVVFERVPPGEYTIKVKAIESGKLEIGGVNLPPGGETDLGPVTLQ
ncbi:MAG: hypothetical protein U9Q79_12255 [Candidatus Hydrogenedentes bacterium]|nr:hypothetical protein [Candidatus Hydrogenedentota bacterium]